jgi:hypothetical protein
LAAPYRQKAGIRLHQTQLPRSERFHRFPEFTGGDALMAQQTIELIMTPFLGMIGKVRLREVRKTCWQKMAVIRK